MLTLFEQTTPALGGDAEVSGLRESIQASQERLQEQQRQLVKMQNQHKAALVNKLREQIRHSGYDHVSILEALLPSGWQLSRRKGKAYERRREPRWQVKGYPSLTYTQGRFSRELQQHMRSVGLDPASQMDRRFFLSNHMERI